MTPVPGGRHSFTDMQDGIDVLGLLLYLVQTAWNVCEDFGRCSGASRCYAFGTAASIKCALWG